MLSGSASPWATEISPLQGSSGTLIAGILLFIPGFITDLLALLLVLPSLQRAAAVVLDADAARRHSGVIDLAPEQWHQIQDPARPERPDDTNPR